MSENFVSTALQKIRASIARENARSTLFNIPRGSLRTAHLKEPATTIADALHRSSELEFDVGPLTRRADDSSNIDLIISLDGQITREHGVSALYCGMGLIDWTDPRDKRSRCAPLLLVPIRAIALAPNGYRIRQVGEPQLNDALLKRIGIPRSAIPEENPLSFRPKKSHEAVTGFSDSAVIGLFSTIRTILADRLDEALNLELTSHPIVNAIVNGNGRPFDPTLPRVTADPYLPCDTTQHAALTAALAGDNILVNGPPGTGKTQTITNIIAQAVQNQRRVLLLSEAPIALQPVINRLGDRLKDKDVLDLRPSRQVALNTSHGRIRALSQDLAHLPLAKIPTLTIATAATYLTAIPAQWEFDMLIIDEASKMRMSYAIPAISRCAQVILVGDHQQCSPSTIIQFSQDGLLTTDGDISILDAGRAAKLHTIYLLRHYRSKHPSLIRFSNRRFYSSRLLAAPSFHQVGEFGCILRQVEGVQANLTNAAEVEQIVRSVVSQFERDPTKVISIIALTYQQCVAIAKSLRAVNLDAYRHATILHASECQGTECDIAYVSLVHGPEEGRSQKRNLGLLGDTDGHRLLNVLLTRARQRTEIYSSIRVQGMAYKDGSPDAALIEFLSSHVSDETDYDETKDNPLARHLNRNDFDTVIDRNNLLVSKNEILLSAVQITGLQADLDDASERAQLENSGWTVFSIPDEIVQTERLELDPSVQNMLESLANLAR